MVDLSGGGQADNVAVTGERVDEAIVELETATQRVRELRSVPGVLGVLASGTTIGITVPYLPLGVRDFCLSRLNQLHSSSSANRLPNQVRGDGD